MVKVHVGGVGQIVPCGERYTVTLWWTREWEGERGRGGGGVLTFLWVLLHCQEWLINYFVIIIISNMLNILRYVYYHHNSVYRR